MLCRGLLPICYKIPKRIVQVRDEVCSLTMTHLVVQISVACVCQSDLLVDITEIIKKKNCNSISL